MGNGCFCKTSNYVRDINLDSVAHKPIVNTKNNDQINDKKINKLMNYFNECEKEMVIKMRKSVKVKKNMNKRKSINNFDTFKSNEHYEIMLKRLLEQKNIKRFGPKRRITIRKEDDLKIMVKEVLKECKDNIKKKINHIKENSDIKNSLIIKKNDNNFKNRYTLIFDRNGILMNNLSKMNNNS